MRSMNGKKPAHVLNAVQMEMVNNAFKQGAYLLDHKSIKWAFSRHALERMIERSGAQSWDDVKPHVEEVANAFAKAMKSGMVGWDGGRRAVHGKWDFRLDLYRNTIATIINTDI
jgi:hypothetical protein